MPRIRSGLYTPPVTPRKLAGPEVVNLTLGKDAPTVLPMIGVKS